jgi:hypothetical protein
MHGINFGVDTLIQSIKSYDKWDKGWNYTGMGQFGECMSYLDSLIIALGRTKQQKAIECITEKAEKLTTESDFSHFRAVAIALESIGRSKGAEILDNLLDLPKVTGHFATNIQKAQAVTDQNWTNTEVRNKALREIILARALYRCGDKNGRGEEILKHYANDLRGHYFLHTSAVLRQEG